MTATKHHCLNTPAVAPAVDNPAVDTLGVDAFDYDLPADRIATHPPEQRSASRLLRLTAGAISDHAFTDLPAFVGSGDVMVFNDTRVIKARLFGRKQTGGHVEVLIERADDHHALALIRASKPPRAGTVLLLEGELQITVMGRQDDLYELRFEGGPSVFEALERHGRIPLPPYLARPAGDDDEQRYQTVYARSPGAVAAPTAGLHFDQAMFDRLRAQGVITAWLTLHVGAGTFQPVRAQRLSEHRMHTERYFIPRETAAAVAAARRDGRRVIAVGTTSLRALEAAAQSDGLPHDGAGETDLFITPGYRFRVVERLLTNFHLPRSTLLMLVSAFAGMEPVRSAYRHAIKTGYRFFSYGDAMLVDRAPEAAP